MDQIAGVYEIAIKVRDLEASEAFYVGTLGLAPGRREEGRRWHFLWVGGRSGMLVLQEEAGEWPLQHFAFTVAADELDEAVQRLRERGVEVSDPIVHDWMNARSAYFLDPDGNQLEFCSPLC